MIYLLLLFQSRAGGLRRTARNATSNKTRRGGQETLGRMGRQEPSLAQHTCSARHLQLTLPAVSTCASRVHPVQVT